jgi:peptidoglycan/xylan/chitin deacetylase (PgdA/CDA1 family)
LNCANFILLKIFLTYDYELFFGSNAGSVEKCLIEPTKHLLEIGEKYDIHLTFFVDVGYLIKLEQFACDYNNLKQDLEDVKNQIYLMIQNGHDVQLHVHPHWEKSIYDGKKWIMNVTGNYKLSDFKDDKVEAILTRYKLYLENLIGRKTYAFRAGGWCIQPFDRFNHIFSKLDIKIDSSVFYGGRFYSEDYAFDFTKAPKKSSYRFETDVCNEVENGIFLEIPISSWRYSPLFYWRLYINGRLNPDQHKMVGDGNFLKQPGRKKSVLTNFTWNHVSTDGYYASKLNQILKRFVKNNSQNMVLIGHPKSMTKFSFKKLEDFVKQNHKKHEFFTFQNVVENN